MREISIKFFSFIRVRVDLIYPIVYQGLIFLTTALTLGSVFYHRQIFSNPRRRMEKPYRRGFGLGSRVHKAPIFAGEYGKG